MKMTKEQQDWYDSHNQNELENGYCKWAKPFVDFKGNSGYLCMNWEACHRWGIELGSVCAEPWLKCNLKQSGIYEIDKDKIDINSIVYPETTNINLSNKKNDKFNYRNIWLVISMIVMLWLLYKMF